MNEDKRHYDRLIAASKAEQILAKKKIGINIPFLLMTMKSRPSEEKNKYYLNGKDRGYIQTKYRSKDKITGRMFTAPGNLNLINLSDPDIKESIVSKHDDKGCIVEIDYNAFEPTIMQKLIGYEFQKDVHDLVSETLDINRNDAKKINNAYFYGMGRGGLIELVGVHMMKTFDLIMKNFEEAKDNYLIPHIESYEKNGYVVNPYGRKIYPRNKNNIFNNIIQSTGSDILIDLIINLEENHSKFDVIFHRFDSLFFDFKKSNIYLDLNELIKIITTNEYNLTISISIGKNLNNLKKLKI